MRAHRIASQPSVERPPHTAAHRWRGSAALAAHAARRCSLGRYSNVKPALIDFVDNGSMQMFYQDSPPIVCTSRGAMVLVCCILHAADGTTSMPIESPLRGTDDASSGTNNASKGTDDASSGTDDAKDRKARPAHRCARKVRRELRAHTQVWHIISSIHKATIAMEDHFKRQKKFRWPDTSPADRLGACASDAP